MKSTITDAILQSVRLLRADDSCYNIVSNFFGYLASLPSSYDEDEIFQHLQSINPILTKDSISYNVYSNIARTSEDPNKIPVEERFVKLGILHENMSHSNLFTNVSLEELCDFIRMMKVMKSSMPSEEKFDAEKSIDIDSAMYRGLNILNPQNTPQLIRTMIEDDEYAYGSDDDSITAQNLKLKYWRLTYPLNFTDFCDIYMSGTFTEATINEARKLFRQYINSDAGQIEIQPVISGSAAKPLDGYCEGFINPNILVKRLDFWNTCLDADGPHAAKFTKQDLMAYNSELLLLSSNSSQRNNNAMIPLASVAKTNINEKISNSVSYLKTTTGSTAVGQRVSGTQVTYEALTLKGLLRGQTIGQQTSYSGKNTDSTINYERLFDKLTE